MEKISLLSYKTPDIPGPKTGVFSHVPHHPQNYDKRYFDTSYKSSYLTQFTERNFLPKTIDIIKAQNIASGNETGFKKNEKIMITTKLISEKYKGKLFKKKLFFYFVISLLFLFRIPRP